MRKPVALLVVMLTFGLLFAGSVSAQDVEVAVINEDGSPVDVTSPGDEVAVEINASANESVLEDPMVNITVDPESGLTFEPEKAVMFFNGEEFLNDLADPFFYWCDECLAWHWWLGWYDGWMYPDDEAMLIAPAMVTDCGPITVNADFLEWPEQYPEPILLDSDSYTFLSVCCHGPCVPMQETGAPLALAALGLLGIIGGAIYGKIN